MSNRGEKMATQHPLNNSAGREPRAGVSQWDREQVDKVRKQKQRLDSLDPESSPRINSAARNALETLNDNLTALLIEQRDLASRLAASLEFVISNKGHEINNDLDHPGNPEHANEVKSTASPLVAEVKTCNGMVDMARSGLKHIHAIINSLDI